MHTVNKMSVLGALMVAWTMCTTATVASAQELTAEQDAAMEACAIRQGYDPEEFEKNVQSIEASLMAWLYTYGADYPEEEHMDRALAALPQPMKDYLELLTKIDELCRLELGF